MYLFNLLANSSLEPPADFDTLEDVPGKIAYTTDDSIFLKKREKKQLDLITHTGREEQKVKQKKLLESVENELEKTEDDAVQEKFDFSKKYVNMEKLTGEGSEVLSQLTSDDFRKKERELLLGKKAKKKFRKSKLDKQITYLENVYNGNSALVYLLRDFWEIEILNKLI